MRELPEERGTGQGSSHSQQDLRIYGRKWKWLNFAHEFPSRQGFENLLIVWLVLGIMGFQEGKLVHAYKLLLI